MTITTGTPVPESVPVPREVFEHKTNRFNREHIRVLAVDDPASDFANHRYVVEAFNPKVTNPGPDERVVERCEINFQNGGLREVGCNGITDQALLAIVRDRLICFNDGPYRCRENSMMITKIEEALMWGEKRANDRSRRDVEGERLA